MVNQCANLTCAKPLHYLREGRIYIFDAAVGSTDPGAKRLRRLEHYWLCGPCSETMMMTQSSQGAISVAEKPVTIRGTEETVPGAAVAARLAF